LCAERQFLVLAILLGLWDVARLGGIGDATEQKRSKFGVGDVSAWTAIDADTKLILWWHVGTRSGAAAYRFMIDLAGRLANRVQLITDGHRTYLSAVDMAFRRDIDYAMLVKIYGDVPEAAKRYSPAEGLDADKTVLCGRPDPEHISTSWVERQNLTMWMSIRLFTQLTNGLSKKLDNQKHALALYFCITISGAFIGP
jgi:hypothetical protein